MDNFKNELSVKRVEFEGETYYSIADVENLYNQKLSKLNSITLPLLIHGVRENVECATFNEIDSKIDKIKLSEFNKKIKKGLDWNPKKK